MSMLPCFVANWKMNKTGSEALDYLDVLKTSASSLQKAEIILAPAYTTLDRVSTGIRQANLPIRLAAQNLYFEPEGAYTGEISAKMLRDLGCQYVIIGHSERRTHFGETDADVRRKVVAASRAGLTPIICIGEDAREREEGKTLDVVRHQLKEGLAGLKEGDVLIAYEPVWAIGTGKTPTPSEAERVHLTIADYLESEKISCNGIAPRVLYGGSISEGNIAAFMKEPHIDGVLVGGASLSAKTFINLVRLGVAAKESVCTS